MDLRFDPVFHMPMPDTEKAIDDYRSFVNSIPPWYVRAISCYSEYQHLNRRTASLEHRAASLKFDDSDEYYGSLLDIEVQLSLIRDRQKKLDRIAKDLATHWYAYA